MTHDPAVRAPYSIGWLHATPLAVAYLLWRSRRQPENRAHWAERVGLHARRADRARDRTQAVREAARRALRARLAAVWLRGDAVALPARLADVDRAGDGDRAVAEPDGPGRARAGAGRAGQRTAALGSAAAVRLRGGASTPECAALSRRTWCTAATGSRINLQSCNLIRSPKPTRPTCSTCRRARLRRGRFADVDDATDAPATDPQFRKVKAWVQIACEPFVAVTKIATLVEATHAGDSTDMAIAFGV